ncbi:MAG TPA: hypothetical protein PKC58_17200 [Ignavibacteria bacterium]|nr:hypothetical protein [Ignavibacteria bacterium]
MNKGPRDILIELNHKFNGNFNDWSTLQNHRLEKSFIGLHCIVAVGEILNECKSSKHHEICCKIYDEIFSDGVSAIYLATNAMDKPANILLRRILELGLAAIYLWDMPHIAFSWNDHDQGLNFKEMINHVNSKGYISYINNENNTKIKSELISASRSQNIYGKLSDIVHGKIATFESSLPERFKFVEEEWNQFIDLFEEVICMLVKTFMLRFNISKEIYAKVPQAKKEFK